MYDRTKREREREGAVVTIQSNPYSRSGHTPQSSPAVGRGLNTKYSRSTQERHHSHTIKRFTLKIYSIFIGHGVNITTKLYRKLKGLP